MNIEILYSLLGHYSDQTVKIKIVIEKQILKPDCLYTRRIQLWAVQNVQHQYMYYKKFKNKVLRSLVNKNSH